MFSFSSISFLSTPVLAALACLPLLWWLLRLMPPPPRRVKFPAFFLLKDLSVDVKTPAKTPWWLLLLRSLLVMLLIFAFADPVEKMAQQVTGKGGSVFFVVDNGWASAAHWKEREAKIKEYLSQVERDGRSVIFLPTAPSDADGKIHSQGPMPAETAQSWIGTLKPQPWADDHLEAKKEADDVFARNRISHALFFSDGVTALPTASKDFLARLQKGSGDLSIVTDDAVNTPYILKRASGNTEVLSFEIERLSALSRKTTATLMAFAEDGALLDQKKMDFPQSQSSMKVTWDLPLEVRNKISRFSLLEAEMASAVYLTDSHWRQRPVGVVSDSLHKGSKSFLNEVYYLKRALQDESTLSVDDLDTLLKQPLSAIIWPDTTPLTAAERVSLLNWVQKGGLLVRFAGPNLAASTEDILLPVNLRSGGRSMQGSMTWEKPLHLGGIGEQSPLRGLIIPQDVTVTRQVLAEPTPESFEKTWATLDDGTPLITGSASEKGSIVLVHTTAGPDWSDFCYSGLYVEALRRMIDLSNGISGYHAQTVLSPLMVMDGYGRLGSADKNTIIRPVSPTEDFSPSPQTPPGLYGDQKQFSVYNMGDYLPALIKLSDFPAKAEVVGYSLSGEKKWKPDLLRLAFFVLLADTLATLFLRGVLSLNIRRFAAVFVILFFAMTPAYAEDVDEASLASGIYLAYIETGDAETDTASYNGLSGLAATVKARTTVRVQGVRGVDPATDKLIYYPFIYWPMTANQGGLSASAARNLQDYIGQGGMLVIDTRDQQFGNAEHGGIGTDKMRKMLKDMQIPELMEVPEGHILTKSFYLLRDFPGRFAGGKLWVESEPSQNFDAVTSVVIGSNAWAEAWTKDPEDRMRYDISPEGERQREMAYRFGVNLVMMSLAGNYKSDQIHIPYILQRVGR